MARVKGRALETWWRQVCLHLCDFAEGEARGVSLAKTREEIVDLRRILGGPVQRRKKRKKKRRYGNTAHG